MQQQRRQIPTRLSLQQGFTLLEVMVVVVIIAIMAAAVVPNIIEKMGEAQSTRAVADIASIENALKLYKMNNYQYPSTDQGLEALVSKPSGDPQPKNWKQQLPEMPMDPWENPYKYLNPGTKGGEFDVYSLGADGVQSEDDIGNWKKEN